jgi:wyosine [tRNA(Phe)-imidazoG37] synthetase (radical SAM superfamily)
MENLMTNNLKDIIKQKSDNKDLLEGIEIGMLSALSILSEQVLAKVDSLTSEDNFYEVDKALQEIDLDDIITNIEDDILTYIKDLK